MTKNTKFKVGDRVIFHFTDDEVGIGHVEDIDSEYTYKIISGNSYYILHEKDIIAKSNITPQQRPPEEEFKEGDEVWIKAKICKFNCGSIKDELGNFLVETNAIYFSVMCIPSEYLFKSIPQKTSECTTSKNEWIRLEEKRRPPIDTPLSCYRKSPFMVERAAICTWRGKEFYDLGHPPMLFDATHWKPLDAPPSE